MVLWYSNQEQTVRNIVMHNYGQQVENGVGAVLTASWKSFQKAFRKPRPLPTLLAKYNIDRQKHHRILG